VEEIFFSKYNFFDGLRSVVVTFYWQTTDKTHLVKTK